MTTECVVVERKEVESVPAVGLRAVIRRMDLLNGRQEAADTRAGERPLPSSFQNKVHRGFRSGAA